VQALTVTRESRDKLVEKLRAVLGPDNSDTLMSMFPKDFDGLATRADLEQIEHDLSAVKSDLADVKSDLADVKNDLADVKSDLAGVKSETTGIKADVARLDGRMDKFEDRLWDLHEAIRAQARVYVTAIVGGMVGLAGVLTAASRIG
jgi:septal ring factor EnvC (AmiA/AmiB activator)